jgi:hypothetical protein
MIGKTDWMIPDGYMNATKNGAFESHEAICVLNLADEDAKVDFSVYFEDRGPMKGFTQICPALRTKHIRLDMVVNAAGETIPRGTPYAVYVKSSIPVVVQHSRMDVSQPAMALMTSVPFSA